MTPISKRLNLFAIFFLSKKWNFPILSILFRQKAIFSKISLAFEKISDDDAENFSQFWNIESLAFLPLSVNHDIHGIGQSWK